MKKLLCLLLQAALAATLSAQVINLDATTTRAVVVGISDYQDDKIPDLRFADRDAEAFANYLRSPAGGSLTADQIMLLTNKQAKAGNLVAAFTWLIEDSKPGDRAIFYFSGHGDVENVTMFQDGYLLAYDVPPIAYMAGGALPVFTIGRIVNTLSGKGVQVVMITDACRAGKLAGSETGGAKATTAALQQQFANEVKILSCQPDEFSLEGEQWGGGRGCFSYHLTDGLCGMADRNADQQVSLMEIGNYLQETVAREAAPQSQIPMTVGNPKAMLATVDEATLTLLKSQRAGELATLKSIESRGMEVVVLGKVDTSVQQLYREFLAAIERGYLMPSAGDGKSADDYYRILIAEPELAQLHGLMKRNFAAALQNEAQEVTNKLLKTDPFVVSDNWSRPFVYDHIPAYLERAAEILGEGHFFYKQLKAKQCFFEAKTYRPEKFPDLPPDSVAWMAAHKFEEALRFDSNAAYVHVEYGFLLWYKLFQHDDALHHALKALELSPNWLYAQYYAGNAYRLRDPSKAIVHLERAIELDSTFLPAYYEMSKIYLLQGDEEKEKYFSSRYIEKAFALIESNPEKMPVIYRTYLGAMLWQERRMEEAEKVLQMAVELSKGQDLAAYQYLSATWWAMGKYEDALASGKKEIELAPFNSNGYLVLSECYNRLNQPQKRIETLEKAVLIFENKIDETHFLVRFNADLAVAYQESGRQEEAKVQFRKVLASLPRQNSLIDLYYIGISHLGLGDLASMQHTIDEGLQKWPDDKWTYYVAACLYSMAKDERKSLEWLELALEKGFNDLNTMQSDLDLDWIRDKPGFKALMKKYFPDQQKK